MHDRTFLALCAVVGILAFIATLFLPAPIVSSDIEVSGVVERVFTPSGITIANLQLDYAIPVVFFEKNAVRTGDHIRVNASLKRYRGRLELVVE